MRKLITTDKMEFAADPAPAIPDQIDPPPPGQFAIAARLCDALATMTKTQAWAAILFITNPTLTLDALAKHAGCGETTIRRGVSRLVSALRADGVDLGNAGVRLGDGASVTREGASAPPGVGSLKKTLKAPRTRRGAQGKKTNAGDKK